MKMVNQGSHFLSGRAATVFVLLLSVFGRLATQLYFFTISDDRSVQLAGARNLVEGKGITISQVFAENIHHTIYTPVVGWPPGYSLLVALLNSITGDIILAAIILDLISAFSLVWFSRKILLLLGCSTALANMYTLVTGFFLYDFCEISTSDLNALAFYIIALYAALDYIRNRKSGAYLFLLALLNFLPAFLRYLYFPLAFVIPSYLFLLGYKTGNRHLNRSGLILISATLGLLILLVVFQSYYTGSPAYINSPREGFFPSNLLEYYPVAIAPWANISFYYTMAEKMGIAKYGAFNEVLLVINALVSALLLFLFFRYLARRKWNRLELPDHYLVLGGFSSILILLLLAALSLRVDKFIMSNLPWTYIQESRYMAFIIMFLQQLPFILIFKVWNKAGKLLRAVGIVLAFFLFLEVLHGMYFTARILTGDKNQFHGRKNYVLQKEKIRQLIGASAQAKPRHRIVFITPERNLTNIASLAGASVIYQAEDNPVLLQNRKMVLYIIADPATESRLKKILDHPGMEKISTIGNKTFYRYESD